MLSTPSVRTLVSSNPHVARIEGSCDWVRHPATCSQFAAVITAGNAGQADIFADRVGSPAGAVRAPLAFCADSRQGVALVIRSSWCIEEMNKGNVALLPVGGLGELMGGHKGYGLATMVEIFSAAFHNGTYLWGLTDIDADGNPQLLRIGHFFLAIDVGHFIELDTFKKITGNLMRELPCSKVAPGQARIYTAGEKEYYSTQRGRKEGVEIPPGVQKALRSLKNELHLFHVDLGF